MEPHTKLIEWLDGAGFRQHPEKLGLYQKDVVVRSSDPSALAKTVKAYVDFRKNDKGIRYCNDKTIDANTIEILTAFKDARDSFFSDKLIETTIPHQENPPIVKSEAKESNISGNQVILSASAQSKILSDVIEKAKLYSLISGKKYVRIEGWETLGALLLCHAEITTLKEYKNGYWAEAAIKNQEGRILSTGTGICLRDEKNWANRDEYAILSMAQTRAIGKAYRLGFSWIMSLSGYEPVPAEEMADV